MKNVKISRPQTATNRSRSPIPARPFSGYTRSKSPKEINNTINNSNRPTTATTNISNNSFLNFNFNVGY